MRLCLLWLRVPGKERLYNNTCKYLCTDQNGGCPLKELGESSRCRRDREGKERKRKIREKSVRSKKKMSYFYTRQEISRTQFILPYIKNIWNKNKYKDRNKDLSPFKNLFACPPSIFSFRFAFSSTPLSLPPCYYHFPIFLFLSLSSLIHFFFFFLLYLLAFPLSSHLSSLHLLMPLPTLRSFLPCY